MDPLWMLLLVLWCTFNADATCQSDQCASLSRNGINRPFSSLSEAELSARCLTICGEEVEGIREGYVTSSRIWTSVDETLLKSENCPLFYETKECQLGCSLRPSSDPVSESNECRNSCRDICEESCSFTQSCDGACLTADCRGTWCRSGCQQGDKLEDFSGSVPSTPLGFEVQPNPQVPAQFEIISVNVSQPSSPEDGISAFIFRVQHAEDTFYVLQSSLTDALDLSYFSCQEVNISLAVVNRNGSSQFTSPTPVCVHGGFPSAPRNLRSTSVVDDPRRPDFLGHAVITLEWDTPRERSEALTGYRITVEARPFPEDCGDPDNITDEIAQNATRYVLRAASVGQLPKFGPREIGGRCEYIVWLTSLPEGQDNSIKFNINSKTPYVTSPLKPNVTYSCKRQVDPQTGLIGIALNFSYEYNRLIQQAISMYTIDALHTAPINNIGSYVYDPAFVSKSVKPVVECSDRDLSSNFTLRTTNESVLGEILVYNFCPTAINLADDGSSNYTLSITFSFDPMDIWWRPIPDSISCSRDGTAERPTVVIADTIRVLTNPPLTVTNIGSFQYNVSLGIDWEPPTAPHGAEEYEVYLGGRPVDEENLNFIPTVSNGTTEAIIQRIVSLQNDEHLYLQIRSRNGFFLSNWSSPKDILVDDEGTSGGGGSSESLPVGVIAAVAVVSVLIVVIITALVVCFYLKHRRRAKSVKRDHRDTLFNQYRIIKRNQSNRDIIGKYLHMEDEWEIPPIALVVEKQLGEGCFGEVYKGFVQGPISGSRTMKDSLHTTVAIKYLKVKAGNSERTDFVNEIKMMKRVAEGRNPHVVSLIGCVTRDDPLCLIIEYLKYGDLKSYLHSIKEQLAMRKYVRKLQATETTYTDPYPDDVYIEEEEGESNTGEPEERDTDEEPQPYLKPVKTEPQPYEKPLPSVAMPEESPYANLGDVEPVNLISFAYQIAAGMEYLSSLEIVHRDLACRNVLVGDGKALKIADFGLSRVVTEGDAYVKTTSGRLPIKWMAIESISDRVFTVQSDVWAFGVVVWEIATLGGFPYPSIPNEELRTYLLQGNRLEKPPNCADQIYETMLQCWQVNPAKRPKFSELRALFDGILMESSSYIQFSSLTDLPPLGNSEDSSAHADLQITGKATNPYVVSPNKTLQAKTTTLSSAPTDETAIIRSEEEPPSSTADQDITYTQMNPAVPPVRSTLKKSKHME